VAIEHRRRDTVVKHYHNALTQLSPGRNWDGWCSLHYDGQWRVSPTRIMSGFDWLLRGLLRAQGMLERERE